MNGNYDLEWYQLNPPPEKKESEEYIQQYLKTKDEKDLAAFLHCYEPRMNRKVSGYVERFSMEGHFAELKSAFIYGLFRAMKTYDPEYGNPFLQYKEFIVLEEILEYVRTMRSGFTVPSVHEFRNLRKVMLLYNGSDRDNSDKNLERIAKEMDISVKLVKELIAAGLRNEKVLSLDKEEEEDTDSPIEDMIADRNPSAEAVCMRLLRWERLKNAFEELTPRQKNVVASHCGICEHCYGTKKKLEFKEIATNNGLSSAEAVEQVYKKAVRRVRDLYIY